MSSSNCSKYEFYGSNADLQNIFTNNSNAVNPLLPFGIHIKGGVNVSVTKSGHTFKNSDNVSISAVRNYGKILVMTPNKKDSELILHYDARNEQADQDGSGKYKLKYICFTCPSTIKIGDSESDMQSYLVYSNDNGLYCVVCTLYRNAAPYDNLANSLLSTLLNNSIPKKGQGSISTSVNITDFLPQNKKDYYEFIHTEEDSKPVKEKILVKVFAKKVNISSIAINTLKEKLFDSASNCTYNNFNDSLNSILTLNPQNLNIFHVPDIGLSQVESTKEKMSNIEKSIKEDQTEEEEYDVEEESTLIEKLTKANLEEKKEKFINFTDDLLVYKIDIKDGSPKKVFNNPDATSSEKLVDYIGFKELLVRNKDYEEDELKRAINEFPNYIYKNAYWCINYKLRLYKSIGDSDTNSDFEIIDVDTIDEAIKKIGSGTKEEVFYAMKNFPNIAVDEYYISYYYPVSNSQNTYVKVMYILLCVMILLFNFIYYRYIYYVTNNDYGDISMDDDEIINDENLKQLASWRLLINIVFFIQIIATTIYSIFKMTRNLSANDDTFNLVFVICCIITLFSTLVYGYLRLHFNDEKVSFAENRSLKLLLENGEDEDDGFINYLSKAGSLMKNNLFYMDGIAQDDGLSSLYTELSELRNEIEQFDSENLNNDNIDAFGKQASNALENLKPHLTENFNYNTNKRSRFSKNIQVLKDTLSTAYKKIESSTPIETESQKAKKKALKAIVDLKKALGGNINNNENNNGNNNANNNANNNINNNNNGDNNENKEKAKIQEGGVNNILDSAPIVTGLKKKNNNDSNFDNNKYESNKVIDGKPIWPNSNQLNEFNEMDDGIEKSDFYENLVNAINYKNLFIYLVFLIIFSTMAYRIRSIIKTFDWTDNQDFVISSSWINLFSSGCFYSLFFTSIFIKGFELYKWYFVGENNNVNNSGNKTIIGYGITFILWVIIVNFGFVFNTEKTIRNSTFAAWLIIIAFLGIQIYIIANAVGFENVYKNMYAIAAIVISILFFVVPPGASKTENVYKAWLILLPIVLYFTYTYLTGILSSLVNKPNIEINIPTIMPNYNNLNNSDSASKLISPISDPIVVPNFNELKKLDGLLEEMKAKGGQYNKQKKKLDPHIKNLTELSEYFRKQGNTENKEMADKIIQNLTDMKL